MSTSGQLAVPADLVDEVLDAAEETFVLFSQDLPHNDLGILQPTSAEIDLDIAGRSYTIKQSPVLLKSTRDAGTTGAVMWKVTPLLAEWLASQRSALWMHGILTRSSNVIELGCGIAGLVGLALAPLISTYILTDQDYVMKLLKANIVANTILPTRPAKKNKGTSIGQNGDTHNIKMLPFDWEHDSVQNIKSLVDDDSNIDLVILCDCIYNMYLIGPLIQTCVDICAINSTKTTYLLIAQQLRSDAVFEQWLQLLMEHFQVWRVKDADLPATLNSTSGYAIHIAVLSQSSQT